MANINGINPPVVNDQDYVDKIIDSFTAVDEHDHSSGKGLPISNGGIAVDAGIARSKLAAGDAHRILINDGDGIMVNAAALTNGQILIGSTAASPVAATLTGTANQVSVVSGAGSITLSTAQDIHSGASPTFSGLKLEDPGAGSEVITITSPTLGSSYSLVLPATSVSGPLKNNGSGVLSFTTIVNDDVSASAAIAGSKIVPNFVGQNISTSGSLSASKGGFANGTAGVPSITFNIDDDTGFFRSAANKIGFTCAGNEQMTLDNNGILALNSATPSNSAQLQVDSTFRGFLPPRMTEAQRDAIASPADGLIVYNNETKRLNIYQENIWVPIGGKPFNQIEIDTDDEVDWSLSDSFYFTIAANRTLTFLEDVNGDSISISVSSNGGDYDVNFPASTRWSGGIPFVTVLDGTTTVFTFFKAGGIVYASYIDGFQETP